MVNYKKQVTLISLGVLSMLLISTAIFINYNAKNEDRGNNPDNSHNHVNPHKNANKEQQSQGKGCSGGNSTVSASVDLTPPDHGGAQEGVEEDCGCHCSKDNEVH